MRAGHAGSIRISTECDTSYHWLPAFLTKVKPQQVTAIPLTEVALEMVKSGMGIITLPKWALKPFIASPELQLVSIGPRGLMRTHYAAIRHKDANKKYITDFIQNLHEELNQ